MKNTGKRDVAFLCQFFFPEYVSSATLPYDVAEKLVKSGYSVGALVGYPKEYTRDTKPSKREIYNGIDIKRVKYLQLKRTRVLGRLINFISFFVSVFFNIRFLKDYRSVIVYSNPPLIPLIAVLAKRLYGLKIIFVSFDVYPEIAIRSGIASENGLMVKFFDTINRILFSAVDKVIALSTDMKAFLVDQRKISESKVEVIPNWYEDLGEITNYTPNEDTPFTISYLGNLGTCQDETTIMQVIDMLKEEPTVRFVFAGHGNKMEKICETKRTNQWENVDIYGFLQGQEYEHMLQASDCFLVTLTEGLLGLCSPSKVISYLMIGRPVICIMDRNAEIAKDIVGYRAGMVFNVGDSDSVIAFVKQLMSSKHLKEDMSKNARFLYKEKYEKSICLQQYCTMLESLLN